MRLIDADSLGYCTQYQPKSVDEVEERRETEEQT